jgi:hypothetical protein
MPFKQFTHCVQPAAYKDNTPQGNLFQVLLDLIGGGGFDEALVICDYLLGGKLVCLGGDRCAIGRVTKMETPADKSFPDSIDNDFSINLLLSPHELGEFAFHTRIDNYNAVKNDGLQGVLITEQPGMPIPREEDTVSSDPNPSPRYHGYTTDYPSSSYISYDPSQSPFQVPGSDQGFQVPVLHLEMEGSRIRDVCAVVSAFWAPVHNTVCSIPFIGPVLCFIASILALPFLPLLLAAVTAAWFAASDGNADDARVGGGGPLELGDRIVVSGRWVYDAGHVGWNEFHPVKTLQKVDEQSYQAATNVGELSGQWCALIVEVPPAEPPGVRPVGMTPGQTTVYDNQLQPENRWFYHPVIDGCEPDEGPPPPR